MTLACPGEARGDTGVCECGGADILAGRMEGRGGIRAEPSIVMNQQGAVQLEPPVPGGG